MKNKDMWTLANVVEDIKPEVRERFQKWCRDNGRTPMSSETIQDWWKEEWIDG